MQITLTKVINKVKFQKFDSIKKKKLQYKKSYGTQECDN